MANAFQVRAASLRKLAEELRQLNGQYKIKIEDLAEKEQELRGMWEGEANMAFQRAFAHDKVSLDNFYTVVERYIQALEAAAAEYERAEAEATQIASARTY